MSLWLAAKTSFCEHFGLLQHVFGVGGKLRLRVSQVDKAVRTEGYCYPGCNDSMTALDYWLELRHQTLRRRGGSTWLPIRGHERLTPSGALVHTISLTLERRDEI